MTRPLLAALAAGLVAFAASAQENTPAPNDPTAQAEAAPIGLSDLEGTVDQLTDDEAPAENRETPAEAPASAEPEPAQAEREAQANATPAAPSGAPAAATRPAPPLTRAEIAAVERTAERGRLLISIARAGIMATQDMLTRISDPEGAGIAGWIAEPEGNGMGVTFYSVTDGAPAVAYRVRMLGGRVVSRDTFLGAERPALTPIQARMAAARTATDALENQACSQQPFNVLVVPPASVDAPVDVYQITPPERGRFPLGGHFRSTVRADGSISETRGFASSCVDLAAPAAGERPPPIGVTHLLDPMPTEIHVFLAQLVGRPLLVATGEPQRVWLVTNERIAEVRP